MLDQAAQCLTKYSDQLSENDFVQKLEKKNLQKILESFDKVMSKVRVQIVENESVM